MDEQIAASLKGKHYLTTKIWQRQELQTLIDQALEFKRLKTQRIPHPYLLYKTIFLLFFDKSTRTRNAFEAGITQLGGHAHYIDVGTSQIAHGESAKDTGIILSSYGDGIAIRHDLLPGEGHAYMREVGEWASVPVINLQCDIDHPTQTLADLMTLQERFGNNLKGMRLAVTWAYAPSYAKPLSVPQGLLLLMPRFGIDVVVAHPPEFQLMPDMLERAVNLAAEGGGKITFTDSMEEAFRNADAVYPKSWGILELFGKPEEALRIAGKYQNWICDRQRMELAKNEAVYMHCLPADRGHEVTDEVIDGPQSVVFQQAENRLHTAKAIMYLTMRS